MIHLSELHIYNQHFGFVLPNAVQNCNFCGCSTYFFCNNSVFLNLKLWIIITFNYIENHQQTAQNCACKNRSSAFLQGCGYSPVQTLFTKFSNCPFCTYKGVYCLTVKEWWEMSEVFLLWCDVDCDNNAPASGDSGTVCVFAIEHCEEKPCVVV